MKTLVKCLILLVLVLPASGCLSTNKSNIAWVDAVRINGITYAAVYNARELKSSELGIAFAKVRVNVAKTVTDPEYKLTDGDATYLAQGTKLYEVKGYRPEYRLAVKFSDGIGLYEADTNPLAKTGKDLLDIEGKVDSIGIDNESDGTKDKIRITDRNTVNQLVTMVMTAPVNQNRFEHGGTRLFICFHLKDKTTITRSYWPDSGELSRGIILPVAFKNAVEKAVKDYEKKNAPPATKKPSKSKASTTNDKQKTD